MRTVLALVVLSVVWCGVVGDSAWTAGEMLALCDGMDEGLPCEKFIDPRSYIPCADARCHKPGEEFGSQNACGRPRPAQNEIPTPEWTGASLDKFRKKGTGKKGTGGRNRKKHGEL